MYPFRFEKQDLEGHLASLKQFAAHVDWGATAIPEPTPVECGCDGESLRKDRRAVAGRGALVFSRAATGVKRKSPRGKAEPRKIKLFHLHKYLSAPFIYLV